MKQHRKALVLLYAALVVLPICAQNVQAQAQAQPAQAQAQTSADKQEAMAKLETISAELQLTAQQKKEMVPILTEEGSKLKAIKSNASLGPMQKAMQMRQVGAEMDAKIKPILTAEQYQKFEQIRAHEREEMIQKMRDQQ